MHQGAASLFHLRMHAGEAVLAGARDGATPQIAPGVHGSVAHADPRRACTHIEALAAVLHALRAHTHNAGGAHPPEPLDTHGVVPQRHSKGTPTTHLHRLGAWK